MLAAKGHQILSAGSVHPCQPRSVRSTATRAPAATAAAAA
jgi:hypothetical protein